ncbi:MAG: CVNH domain-containing protein [Nostoc sp.]
MSTLKKSKLILKTVTILFPMFLGTCIVQPKPALAGNYIATCNDAYESLIGTILRSRCTNKNGERVYSTINLSDIIVNRNGNLSWSNSGGNFQSTCSNINLKTRTGGPNTLFRKRIAILSAYCGDGKGGHKNTSINLSDRISNQNGVLAFDR